MNRAIEFEYNGRSYEAYCPAAALFDIYDHFGGVAPVPELTHFEDMTREGWDAACWLMAELCRWGELRRRHMGETPRDMLTVAELSLAPAADVPRIRVTIAAAVAAGFRRDIPDEEEDETDLVLQELEGAQKKTPPAGSYGPGISV
jgi:hypothetical protein